MVAQGQSLPADTSSGLTAKNLNYLNLRGFSNAVRDKRWDGGFLLSYDQREFTPNGQAPRQLRLFRTVASVSRRFEGEAKLTGGGIPGADTTTADGNIKWFPYGDLGVEAGAVKAEDGSDESQIGPEFAGTASLALLTIRGNEELLHGFHLRGSMRDSNANFSGGRSLGWNETRICPLYKWEKGGLARDSAPVVAEAFSVEAGPVILVNFDGEARGVSLKENHDYGIMANITAYTSERRGYGLKLGTVWFGDDDREISLGFNFRW